VTSTVSAELFLACDMPLIEPVLLRQIIEQFQTTGRAVFARVARTTGFPCIVPCNKAAVIEQLIDRKSFSMQKLASSLRAKFADFEGREANQLININTPVELRAARRRRAPQKSR
jgi:molybdopterin-guanine dinucleotide biosynthesis protein A